MTKRAVFIGRWSPFHNGHFAIMKKKIEEGKPLLVLIRDTPYDIYPPLVRKRMIEAAMAKQKVDAKVLIIDDIESVNYGRGVGYEVNEIEVPDNIKRISATEIRAMIQRGDSSWKEIMPEGADKVLENYLKDKGVVVWFTGMPKSGKTSISNQVSVELENHGIRNERLDGSILRKTISKDLSFTKEDRDTNLMRAVEITKMLSRNGAVVLCSFVTPYESQREMIRKQLDEDSKLVEVYVKASMDQVKERDKDGLYKKAEEGKIEHMTGVDDPFEEPKDADIVIDTEKMTDKEAAKKIFEYINNLI